MEYEPGASNIGPAERRRRLLASLVGFSTAGVHVAVVHAQGWPAVTLLAAAAPLFLGVVGALQAYHGFCVGFALGGVYDVSDAGTCQQDVESERARRRDVARARTLTALALAVTALATAALYAAVPP